MTTYSLRKFSYVHIPELLSLIKFTYPKCFVISKKDIKLLLLFMMIIIIYEKQFRI